MRRPKKTKGGAYPPLDDHERIKQIGVTRTKNGELILENIDFTSTDFSEYIFHKVILKHVTFTRAKMQDANFEYCKLHEVTFNHCEMTGTSFETSQISNIEQGVTFNHCEMTELSFLNVELNQVIIFESVLHNVVFDTGHSHHVQFQNSKIDNGVLLNIQFHDVKFDDDCQIVESIFKDAILQNVEFNKSSLENVEIVDTTLRNVRLERAMLRNVTFHRTNLWNVMFHDNDLQYAVRFSQSEITRSNFSTAKLQNVEFISVQLSYINFTNAIIDQTTKFTNTTFSHIRHNSNVLKRLIDTPSMKPERFKIPALNTSLTDLNTSSIQPYRINKSDIDNVFDPINGNVSLAKALEEEDNIVFFKEKVNETSAQPGFAFPRSELKKGYANYSSIFTACKSQSNGITIQLQNTKENAIYFKLILGFVAIIPVQLMKQVLDSTHRTWLLKPENRKEDFIGTLSLVMQENSGINVLGNSDYNAVSADHCQEGTSQSVYTIVPIKVEEYVRGNRRTKHRRSRIVKTKRKTPVRRVSTR